ncbi:MAG: peptidase dimerization domain protein [Solirubrobacterales bacterium]|nr:peptidase dimerization domain protein [Solirubrobacterales bacterium]
MTRRATDDERARLHEEFAQLCRIRSVSGEERAVADHVTQVLRDLGHEVEEDDSAAASGAGSGNLLCRIAGAPGSTRSVLFCAHLDTVPHPGDIEPVLEDGGWVSAGDTILGADNKAAVVVLLALARRYASGQPPPPIGLELLFTASEEVALAGAKAFDCSRLRSDFGYVYDHASPIGEIVMASPTYHRIEARFHGRPAHAGIWPEDGRSAVLAASLAVAAMPFGRLDPETTTNVGSVHGGVPGTNVVAEHCVVLAEARSLDETKVEAAVAAIIDACQDAAGDPRCSCDLDLDVQRLFRGYKHTGTQPSVVAAEAALRACGHTPKRIVTGGGSDANAFAAQGFVCTNLANGTERNHEPTERVSADALEGMLEVTFALLEQLRPAADTEPQW